MANPKPSPSIYNYIGLAFVLGFFGMMLVGGMWNAFGGHMRFGGYMYAVGAVAVIFGFMTKEDTVSIGGLVGFNVAIMLDIALNIGVLTHW